MLSRKSLLSLCGSVWVFTSSPVPKGEIGIGYTKSFLFKYCRITLVCKVETSLLWKMTKRENTLFFQRRKFFPTFQLLMSRILSLEHHSFSCWVQPRRLDYSEFKVFKSLYWLIPNYFSVIFPQALKGDKLQSFGFWCNHCGAVWHMHRLNFLDLSFFICKWGNNSSEFMGLHRDYTNLIHEKWQLFNIEASWGHL